MPPACTASTASGTVSSFSFAPKGELDGLILLDGTVVRFAPHNGSAVDAIVDVGDAVGVEGCLHTGPGGDSHLRASKITNTGTSAFVDIS